MNNNGELLQVFTPKFVHDTIEKMNNNAITREEAVKILTESDWLEPELLSEIQKHFSLSTDIDYIVPIYINKPEHINALFLFIKS